MDAFKFLKVQQIIASLLIAMPPLSSEEWEELIEQNAFFNNIHKLGRDYQHQIDETITRNAVATQRAVDIKQFKDWLFDNAPHSVWETFVDEHVMKED